MGESTKVHCTYCEDPDGTLMEMIEVYKIPIIETDYEKQIIKSEKLDKIYTNAANIKFAAEAQKKNYEALKSSIFRKELQGVIE